MSEDLKNAMTDFYSNISFGGGGSGGGWSPFGTAQASTTNTQISSRGNSDHGLAGGNLRPSEIGQCVLAGATAGATTAALASETGPGALVAGIAVGGITTMSCIAQASMN